jgi:hypothetical protein
MDSGYLYSPTGISFTLAFSCGVASLSGSAANLLNL